MKILSTSGLGERNSIRRRSPCDRKLKERQRQKGKDEKDAECNCWVR